MSDPVPARPLWGRILSGVRWTLLLRLVARSIGLVTTLVVARLVPVAELGAYGAILIGDAALQAITQMGFTTAVVQMKKDPTPYLDTAWTSQILRAALVFAVEYAVAPFWCDFFHVPEATTPMRVLALGHVVLGFHSMSTAVLMRELKFDRLFYTYAAESVTHALVTIPAALVLRNIWAPIAGLLAGYTVRTLVSYAVSPVRAGLRFDRAKAREMFAFTKWIGGYAIADFVLETTDNAVTGRVLGKVQLAHYRMAYQLATEGPLSVQWVIARVALPAFSALQDDPAGVRAHLRAMLAVVATTMAPLAAALVLLGGDLIAILLGDVWRPVTAPLRILAIGALLRAIIDTAPPVLRSLGKTRIDFGLRLLQVTVLCALLYPAGRAYGVEGIAGAVVVAAAVTIPFWAWVLHTRVGVAGRDFIRALVVPGVATAAAATATWAVPATPSVWASLLLRGALLLAIYAGVTLAFRRVAPSWGLGTLADVRTARA